MRGTFLSLLLVVVLVAPLEGAEVEFFEKKIRPVLVQHCYPCHSNATKQRGGLALDTRAGLRKGGDHGPALVPGKPAESLLIRAIRGDEKVPQMPPKGTLPPGAVAALEEWVRAGAPDPRETPTSKAQPVWEEVLRQRGSWWSLRPVRKPGVPTPADSSWSRDPVDRFLLAALERAGVQPAGPADRRALLRRLTLVLTGLPPTIEEVQAFVADTRADAVERVVDRLLASPHFGERWARHWLDVVRYGETHGNEWNYEVHHAWRYRDYLIRAFSQDVPFDQLVREHIAGDLLPRPRRDAHGRFNESAIGTAFYRFGEVNHDDCISLPQIGYDLWDNQLDTLTKAFQATTVACARCHDHKIDAISTRDYHALLGVLRSSRLVSHTLDDPNVNASTLARMRALVDPLRKEIASVWLHDARLVSSYLLATSSASKEASLDIARLGHWKKTIADPAAPPGDLFGQWRTLAKQPAKDFAPTWRKLATQNRQEPTKPGEVVLYADFRTGIPSGWEVGGQGLRNGPTRSGDFTMHPVGETLVDSILPAGCFTHGLSQRLNGTLRSPLLPSGKKYISFEVMGRRSSAVRLVSNGCQLNYKNYRALTSNDLGWVTFELPPDVGSLRVYAELMTMLDNPKFPDQLSALGGDPAGYRMPWEQAIGDGRSYFGVTRVLLHDSPKPPTAAPTSLDRLFAEPTPTSLTDLARRYAEVIESSVHAWAGGRASDDDVRWLDGLLRRQLLTNRVDRTPRLASLAQEHRAFEQSLRMPMVVPGVADADSPVEQPVFTRGDCNRPGERVPRRYLEVLTRPGERFRGSGSGRLELAEHLASPENPLTARVMVNRVWHHLFGSGLVRTVDDFGHVGDRPSHPELLDYLAAQFVEEGWSVKRLVRKLVLTRTFGLSARPPAGANRIDPENRLLHHFPARRLEAEGIRDAILLASGRLDRQLFGPSVQPFRDKPNADRRLFPGPIDGAGRRSVYVKNNLMESPAFLGAFDFPGGKVAHGRRHVTNVPAQTLALLNDPFVLTQAERWADVLVARPNDSVAGRVDHLFEKALGRSAGDEERRRFEAAARQMAELHGVANQDLLTSRVVWQDLAHTMFNLQEFVWIP